MCHPATLAVEELLKDCRIQQTRRSGPGGQHRNKVQTAVVVEHQPTGVCGEASERRSQIDNRRQAIRRLRVNLALAIRKSMPAAVPREWSDRTQSRRIAVNPQHEDFPVLLAIALDTVWSLDFILPEASERLGISTSQLIKFLKLENAALTAVNKERKARGLAPLK